MQQDTSGPDPLRPGGPDEDLAAFGDEFVDSGPAVEADKDDNGRDPADTEQPAAGWCINTFLNLNIHGMSLTDVLRQ